MKSKPKENKTQSIWGYKTDLAEINKNNYKLILLNYFSLNTRKIVLMAMILALNILLTLFSRYVLGLFTIAGFFVIEISFCSVLMFLYISNLFYSLVFLEITVWSRVVMGSEPIGLIAMNLIDGFFLIIYAVLIFCFKVWCVNHSAKNIFKNIFWFEICVSVVVILLTSSLAVLLNSIWFLKWWQFDETQIKGILPIIFGLNIVKYLINLIIYFAIHKRLTSLIQHYNL